MTVLDISRTEDRVDLEPFGEDGPHSLPLLRPARFPEVHQQERRLYGKMLLALRRLRARLFSILDLRDTGRRAGSRHRESRRLAPPPPRYKQVGWEYASQLEWNRAVNELLVQLQGSTDIAAASEQWYFSEAVLPEEWQFGMRVGLDRATLLTGAAEASVTRFDATALRAFGEGAFERLSVGGQSRLREWLTGPGSVEEIIRADVEEAVNPLTTARNLSRRFNEYEDWEFARLTRTEAAYAQETGLREELAAEGFQELAGAEYPPFHPNCVCSQTVDTVTRYILPDVSPTACQKCQSALAQASALLLDAA